MIKFVFARRRQAVRCACWDGGVRRLLPEMTYSATGFSNPVRVIFDAIFIPRPSRTNHAPWRPISARRSIATQGSPHCGPLLPAPAVAMAWRLAKLLAGMHHGKLNAYLAYVLFSLLLVLLVAWALTAGV